MYKHGNMGKFTESELVGILNKYGTLSDNGEESILEKTLTSIDKKHEIKVSEIWNVPFTKEPISNTVKFSMDITIFEGWGYEDNWGDGNFEVPKGTTWREFLTRERLVRRLYPGAFHGYK